jgi:uncharacterized Tic20 family protein
LNIAMTEQNPPVIDASPVLDKKARQWAMICHASALVTFLGFAFGNILIPLIIWLVKRDEHPFIDENGKESLNFQISMTIYGVIAGFLVFVLVGFALLAVLLVADLILVIIATLRADKGETYRYPFTIRFLK